MCDTRLASRLNKRETLDALLRRAVNSKPIGINPATTNRLMGHLEDVDLSAEVLDKLQEINEASIPKGLEGDYIAPIFRSIEDFRGMPAVIAKIAMAGQNAQWLEYQQPGCDEVTGRVVLGLNDAGLEVAEIDPRSPCLWPGDMYWALKRARPGSGHRDPLRTYARFGLELCRFTVHPVIPEGYIASASREFGNLLQAK